MKLFVILYFVVSSAIAQQILISANPDLLYSTSNDYGPWGAPEFLNSPNNDYGPVGSPEWLGSVSNNYGVGLRPEELLILRPNIITLEELTAPFERDLYVEPIE
jgi:hypothetical protein